MTLKELNSLYLYDTLESKWYAPSLAPRHVLIRFQQALRCNDVFEEIKGIMDVSEIIYRLAPADYLVMPRGFFSRCWRARVDGDTRSIDYYVFGGIKYFDE
nr:hypothetical protein OIUHVQDI_OIUHVQDI_CDS_0005 [Microvirus sp.]